MTKISKDFQDYDDDDPKVDKHKVRYQYWNKLVLLREEYYHVCNDGVDRENKKFMEWIADTYGFEPIMNDSGITDDYNIVDEKKYTYFILKYG